MSSPNTPARVRFAPSPTGYLHIGAMRSALFNWLWARHTGGVFVLRLEDTDRARLVPDAAAQIYASHDALGITPDEGPVSGGPYGPYVQSERLSIYHEHAEKLLANGALYRCWCTPERLTALREEAQKAGAAFKYDRHCLIPENQGKESEAHVLRFRIPEAPETIGWDDAVRGHLEVRLDSLDDFVAVKADGYPTYHFANIVDDHLMQISHVLRADEWLPSTPKHLLLWEAFGWSKPIYAHLPAVQGPNGGKKLSKRDGAKSVQEYLDEGYLPEALRSFLASLGWNDGTTQEVYTTPELVERFTLDRIQKSPAKFDIDRLTWMNGLLIRQMELPELEQRAQGFWPASAASAGPEYRQRALGLVQERLKFLSELPELTGFFFEEPSVDTTLLTKNFDATAGQKHLAGLLTVLEDTAEWTEASLEPIIRAYTEQQDLKTGQFFGLIRIAVTGRTAAPGLFETLATLGRDTVMRRLQAVHKQLS
jgi:glutamyl-tRNA synthetase